MGESTAISWADHTFNPWWGCSRVSPGCQNCYAEAFAKRTGHDVWGQQTDRRMLSDAYWRQPLKWNRAHGEAGDVGLVFCASMADVFEDRPELAQPRARVFDLIDATPHLVWMLLTKRPENIAAMVPAPWMGPISSWPSNVWVGTTAEDQQRASERLPHLVKLPAPVRFVSAEPLLGPVDLSPWIRSPGISSWVDWVIVGGESGPHHRPMDLDHARFLRDQCRASGVPFLFKQVGGLRPTTGGHELDGREHHEFPPAARRVPA